MASDADVVTRRRAGHEAENVPRKEVATEIDVSGRLDNPQTSTVQAIVKLIQNAFFKAILPGFDREVRQSGRSE